MDEKELPEALERAFGGKFYQSGKNPIYFIHLAGQAEKKIIENPLLIAALQYCKRGWSVIPMAGRVEGPQEVKKYCLLKTWKQFQTIRATPGQIREWWATWPLAMIGVVTGAISGIISVDVDTPEGDAIFQTTLPEGLTVPCCKTPRGGKHYLFQYRAGIKSVNTGPYEILSNGRIVILPPSKLSDGRNYLWI